jgi:hypothetical protein|tara:strand:+ start:3689 stop:4105 length:417 start_codon:yes stop_codon:yes gene_type:complete
MKFDILLKNLTYLGLVPFIGIYMAILTGYDFVFEFKIYAALILSFLGGINWGVAMIKKNSIFLLKSVVVVILCWLLFLIKDNIIFMIGLSLLYLLQLYFDLSLKNKKIYNIEFYNYRIKVTIIVVILLLSMILPILII